MRDGIGEGAVAIFALPQCFFYLPALGFVLHDFQETLHLAGCVAQGHHQPAAPKAAAIFAEVPALVFSFSLSQGAVPFCFRLSGSRVFWGEDDSSVLADDFSFAIAQQPLGACVPTGNVSVGVEGEDGVVFGAVENQLQVGFAIAQCCFCLFALGNVACEADNFGRFALLVADQTAAFPNIDPAPVFVPNSVLDFVALGT